jgi:serine/threonine-protein kinase
VVHRDVKPGNVLVAGGDLVKVADFGIAWAAGSAQLTETGTVLGTADYMAPEAASGAGAAAPADVYGAGVVLYELLTGEAPFTGGPPAAVALRHLRETPRPPRELVPGIPPGLEAAVLAALAKDPQARPDAQELRAQLLAGPVEATAVTAVLPPRSARRRREAIGLLAALALLGSGLALAGALAGGSGTPAHTGSRLRHTTASRPAPTGTRRPATTTAASTPASVSVATPPPTTATTTVTVPAATPPPPAHQGPHPKHRKHGHHGHGHRKK